MNVIDEYMPIERDGNAEKNEVKWNEKKTAFV